MNKKNSLIKFMLPAILLMVIIGIAWYLMAKSFIDSARNNEIVQCEIVKIEKLTEMYSKIKDSSEKIQYFCSDEECKNYFQEEINNQIQRIAFYENIDCEELVRGKK